MDHVLRKEGEEFMYDGEIGNPNGPSPLVLASTPKPVAEAQELNPKGGVAAPTWTTDGYARLHAKREAQRAALEEQIEADAELKQLLK